MTRKTLVILIGILALAAALSGGQPVCAAGPPPKIKILKDCEPRPKYEAAPDRFASVLDFRLAFERARTKFHMYAACVIDSAASSMLGGDQTQATGVVNNGLGEMSNPKTACPNPRSDLTKKLNDANTQALLQATLEEYNHYAEQLKNLLKAYDKDPPLDTGQIDFVAVAVHWKDMHNRVENEMQNAIVGLSNAFTMLGELRQVYVMHVQFQCMLQNLTQLRDYVGRIRKQVAAWPDLFTDASIHN